MAVNLWAQFWPEGPGGHGFLRLICSNNLVNIEKELRWLTGYLQRFYG